MRGRLTSIIGAIATLAASASAQFTPRKLDVLAGPAWPRAAGLADIGAATALPEGLFYNPALAGSVAAIAGSGHFFGNGGSLTTLVSGVTTGAANVGAGVQLLRANLGSDPLVDPLGVLPDDFGQTTVSTVGASMRFKGIRWGASVKYIQVIERRFKDDAAAFDLGAHRPIGPISIGLAVQHLGSDLDLGGEPVELPTRVTLAAEGQGLPIGAFIDFGAAAALAVDRDGEVLPALAGQVLYTPLDGWTFTARAGVRRPVPSSNQRPVTAGLAITLDRLTLDYAIDPVENGDAVHRIGLRLR
ncbi:MAG TPA: hypothetical protein VJ717_08570 [Gemmatimonadaceae bacterium]|nr:hypothetical protein [Gemmatimonadaceae bacterium]